MGRCWDILASERNELGTFIAYNLFSALLCMVDPLTPVAVCDNMCQNHKTPPRVDKVNLVLTDRRWLAVRALLDGLAGPRG